MKIAVVLFGVLAVCILISLIYGISRWQGGTRQLRARIEQGRRPALVSHYDSREVMGLPMPVRRYFETVLHEGQAMVASVEIEHEGTFNMGESEPQWKRFRSTQLNVMQRPGFDWNGEISMLPGLPVFVHDAYVGGEGILKAELYGLVTMASVSGTREAAEGELMRFLAEAAWYPTRLLPSQGVKWESTGEDSARATLVDGDTRCALDFHFGADGMIDRVRAAARYRTVGNKLEPAPWEGRFWNYQLRDNMRVPLEGEVAWMLPSGPWPYWRGKTTKLLYRFEGQ